MSLDLDDTSIPETEILWRRILRVWLMSEEGQIRPQSVAFVDGLSGKLSVYLASETDLDELVNRYAGQAVAAIPAAFVRALGGLVIQRDPSPEEPSHALVIPTPRRSAARRIAKNATWIYVPKGWAES